VSGVPREPAVGWAGATAHPDTGPRPATTAPRPVPAIEAALGDDRPPAPRSRFVQLTYTSFHRPGGVGGRQVKEVSGDLTAEEQQPLTMRAVGPDTGKLEQFLTPDEVDRLPRRLVYGPPWEGAAAYWHSVPAGIDSSGRPGNVFAHILLDRRPAEPTPPLRPSDLLRSRWWLRPFGDEEVRAAGLAAVPEPPWPADDDQGRAAVLDFLAERAVVNPGVLSGLLDAVVAAMQHGPMVVLGVEDDASAEMWVAAVCHLMSPGTSRQLYFATAERATGLAAARAAGLHLVVVPCADLAQLEPDESVVLISDEDLAVEFVEYDVDDEDQQHETRYRSRIPVTPCSTIAAAVVRERQLTADLLALQDEVAAEAGDDALPCGWPLAMAIVLRTLVRHELTALDYAAPAAAALIAQEQPPPGVRRGTRLHRADRLVRERALGQTTAEAWAVVAGPRRGDDRTSAMNTYLERALRDAEWLCRADGVPVPPVAAGDLDADVVTQARVALGRLAAPAAVGDPDLRMREAVRALRLLDLAVRSGLVDAYTDAELVDAALAAGPGPLLLDPATAAPLVERVGTLTETTQARVVRPWFDARLPGLPGRPGCRLPTSLLRWLFPEPPAPISPSGLAHAGNQPATLVEAVLAATAVLADPSAFRAFAVAATLATSAGELDRVAQGPALAVTDVEGLLDAVEPHRLVPVLAPTLRAAPTGPVLDGVVGRVRAAAGGPEWDTPAGRTVQDAAELRHLETGWSRVRDGHDRWQAAGRLAALLRPLLQPASTSASTLADGLVESGMAADVVDRICRRTEPDGPPLAQLRPLRSFGEDEVVMRRLARRVAEAVENGVAAELDVALAAQSVVWGPELRQLGNRWWEDLAEVRWTAPGGRPERLLDHVVRIRLTSMWSERKAALVADVREEIHRAVNRQQLPDPRRVMHDCDEAALKWWRMLGVGDDALGVLGKRWW
jgi:hypothetical protein